MRLNHCFEVIGCLKSLFHYIATIKFPPGLCDEQVTLQSHVETSQCRHKPISKFTCNSYEGNLSCLINSGLLRSRPSDAIKKSYLRHFPASISLNIKGSKLSETLHTCRVFRWSCCSQSLIIACEAQTKDFHRPLKFFNLPFAFSLPVITFVTKCYYTCDLYYICDQLLHLCLQQRS